MKRREFLKAGCLASGSFLLYMVAPKWSQASIQKPTDQLLGSLIRIDQDNQVTIYIYKQEMGQGASTGIAMIAAEELDADWKNVKVEFLDFDQTIKGYETDWGRFDTGGSYSIEAEWELMRTAGATARAMLLHAAALRWNEPISQCRAEKGYVTNLKSGEQFSYGELTSDASRLKIPEIKQFKPKAQRNIIGQSLTSLKSRQVVDGSLKYTLDRKIDGMVYAMIARPPVLGGKLNHYDANEAKTVRGVIDVFELAPLVRDELFDKGARGGIVIIANSTWACIKAKTLLKITWDDGVNAGRNCSDIFFELDKRNQVEAKVLFSAGNANKAIQTAHKIIEAEYTSPYLGHGLMEPLNSIADFSDGKHLEVWAGTQSPQHSATNLAPALNIEKKNIVIHPCPMGGGYGRRYFVDFVLEAALISRQVRKVIKLVWSREDEIQFGTYHPLRKDYFKAGLDANGNIESMSNTALSTHLWAGAEMPMTYGLKNYYANSHYYDSKLVNWGSWRAVVKHHDTFSREIFIDEIANSVKQDPLAYRIKQLERPSPNHFDKSINDKIVEAQPFLKRMQVRLLKEISTLSKWSSPRKVHIGLGVAITAFHDRSFCAQVVEVEVVEKSFRVNKVYVAADVGIVVNPNLVKAQIESSVLWALTPVLYGGVQVENGKIKQSNFHDMPLATAHDAPEIIIKLYDFEDRPPCGVGEFAVTPLAPAISNAIFDATGERKRRLHMAN